jgi:hypothetical protein
VPPGAIAPELNAPLSDTTECVAVSLFIHVTLDPTEILIELGLNPPLTIVALTDMGVGDIGELLPHAVAAVKTVTATIILVQMDMIRSFLRSGRCNRSAPLAEGNPVD